MKSRLLARALTTAGNDISTLSIFTAPETDVPQVLVTRPQKGVFWGKGGQYIKVQKGEIHAVAFKKGQVPSIRRIVRFLESELVLDIKVLDVTKFTQNHICSTAICGVGQNPRHISKAFYSLVKAVSAMQLQQGEVPGIQHLSNPASRTSEWQMLSLKDLFVHLMTSDYRTQMDLEEVLKNPPSTEDLSELDLQVFQQYYNKGRKNRS